MGADGYRLRISYCLSCNIRDRYIFRARAKEISLAHIPQYFRIFLCLSCVCLRLFGTISNCKYIMHVRYCVLFIQNGGSPLASSSTRRNSMLRRLLSLGYCARTNSSGSRRSTPMNSRCRSRLTGNGASICFPQFCSHVFKEVDKALHKHCGLWGANI